MSLRGLTMKKGSYTELADHATIRAMDVTDGLATEDVDPGDDVHYETSMG